MSVNCERSVNSIHSVCDKWIEPSIKEYDRENRGSLRGIYFIKRPAEIRPSDLGEALKNKSFKEGLIGFFIEVWKDDFCLRTLQNKTVYANYNNCCYI